MRSRAPNGLHPWGRDGGVTSLGGAHGFARNVATAASAAGRLLRAYAVQVEALRRLRSGGSQFVRVEHVHVNEGGQAVIGPVAVDRTQGASAASFAQTGRKPGTPEQ